MYLIFQNYLKKHKRVFLSLGVFLIVFLSLGLPFTKWGFANDDFGNVFYAQVKDYKDFLKFFYQDTRICLWPSNYEFGRTSFFSVYYRPFIFVFYYLQSLLFGISPYGFFLTTVFFHALNSVLLFNLVLCFSNYLIAFLAAMFFAFHSSLLNWFVWISAQQQQISLFLILLVFIFFKKYLDSNKFFYYLMSLLFFVVALLTRETALFLPFFIWYFLGLYQKNQAKLSFNYRGLHVQRIVFAFIIIDFLYLLLRLILFPIQKQLSSSVNCFDFIYNLKSRGYELICFMTDFLDLSLFPPGHSCIKFFVFVIAIVIFFVLFVLNSNKKWVLFFILSGFGFLWPTIFAFYGSRYIYEALPFFILAIVFLFQFCSKKIPKFLNISGIFVVSFLIVINFCFLFFFMTCRENDSQAVSVAYNDLVKKVNLGKALCFIGIPIVLSNNVEPAIWLRDGTAERPVYCDFATSSCVSPSILTWFKRFYYFLESFDENLVSVTYAKNSFKIKTLDSEKVFFGKGGIGEIRSSMGKIIVDEIDKDARICKLTFIVDEKWLQKHPIFVSWNYKTQKFVILN
jgi:hypothetical protein